MRESYKAYTYSHLYIHTYSMVMEQGLVREAYKQFVADVEACATQAGGNPGSWQAPQSYEDHLEEASSRASSAMLQPRYVCVTMCVV